MDLDADRIDDIIERLGGRVISGSDTGYGRSYEKPGGNPNSDFHVPYPISSELLREILEDEGFQISDDIWNELLGP